MAKDDAVVIDPIEPDLDVRMVGVKQTGLLELLAELLTKDLLTRIASGKASPADRSVARALLRDAGIELTGNDQNTAALSDVLAKLPYSEDDGEEEQAARA